MQLLQQKIGARLRGFRKAKRYSIEELAHQAGLNATHLAKMERGEVNFTMDSLERVLAALQIPPSLLFELEENIPAEKSPMIEKVVARMQNMTIEEQRLLYKATMLFYPKRDQQE